MSPLRLGPWLMGGCALASVLAAPPAPAETRGYVVSWFSMAMNSQDGDCPGGTNLPWNQHRIEILAQMGYPQKDIERMVKEELAGKRGQIQQIIGNRGRLNGQPVNPYTYPATVPDPGLHAVRFKYEYGFNLDGKRSPSPRALRIRRRTRQVLTTSLRARWGACVSSGAR